MTGRDDNACPPPVAGNARATRVRQLNDQFRRSFTGGQVMISPGIQNLASDQLAMVVRRVSRFDAFTADNDPYDEHDFGSLELLGNRVFWKIDCYDRMLEHGSPDPADPEVTVRVLTIMLANEY